MNKNNITRGVLAVFSIVILFYILNMALSLYKKNGTTSELDRIANEARMLLQPVTGVGSEFDTESHLKESSKVLSTVAQKFPEGSPQYYSYALASKEKLILGNMSTDEQKKREIATNAYNFTHKVYKEVVLKTNNTEFSSTLAKSVVAPYQFFEQYCFRPDWFLNSDWATEEVFKAALAKYPDEKTMSIFLAFSEKLESIPVQDNVVIGNNMRVTSYLLHSFSEKLSELDRNVLLNRLIKLRTAYEFAPTSYIYGNNFMNQTYSLVVTPSIEFAYATEIVSRYKPDLVTSSQVEETYRKTIGKIKVIVDANNKPIYMVNKFMWINLMYLGYLHEKGMGSVFPESMYPVITTMDEYTLVTSEYPEGRESVRSYEAAVESELGNWDQIRKRGYSAVDAVRADKFKRFKSGEINDPSLFQTPGSIPLPPQIN